MGFYLWIIWLILSKFDPFGNWCMIANGRSKYMLFGMQKPPQGLPLSLEKFIQEDKNSFRRSLEHVLTGSDGKKIPAIYLYGDGKEADSLESEIAFGFQVEVIRKPSMTDDFKLVKTIPT